MDCIFCKIAKGELKSDTVYEDAEIRIFKDINPKAPVHLLVISKTHIQSVAHLKDNHSAIISKIIYVAKETAFKMGLRGYKLIFNVGREGGQIIDHLHLHILGGWGNGKIKSIDV